MVEPSVDGVSKKEIWFPEGKWWSVAHGKLIDGGTVRSLDYTLDQIPYFYRQGAVIVKNPPEVKHVTERPDALVLDIVAGADGACEFYEDAGDNADYATKYATTSISHKQRGRKAEYTIAPRKGAYEGMPLSRSYKMRIFNTPRPVKAKEGGRSLQPSYDASSRCTIVDVPSSPCDKGVKVTVEYAD